jgi:2-oxoglutarate ferredoxin oxidoreductase subunit alpha
MMGQMMEPVEFPEPIDPKDLPPKPWKLDGAKGRPSRILRSLLLEPEVEEALNWKLDRKYQEITQEITSFDTYETEDASLVVAAYGTAARIAKGAVKKLRNKGLRVGLFRPVTLWPFPGEPLLDLTSHVKDFLTFEMSTGQMVEDVKLATLGNANVHFYGRPGGIIPTPDEIAGEIQKLYEHRHLQED